MLEILNKNFLSGALELRYITHDGVFTNRKPRGATPLNTTYLRSIYYKTPGKFLFVMDIDYYILNEGVIDVARALYKAIYNLYGIEPLLKASGNTGAQVIFKIKFGNEYSEDECLENMCNTAYTLWLLSRIDRKYHVGFGERKKEGGLKFIDSRMYQRRRMIRSFCLHQGSGYYSVPFDINDSLDDVIAKMRLDKNIDMDNAEIPSIKFSTDMAIYKYKRRNGGIKKADVQKLLTEVDLDIELDDVFDRLPKMLRAVVLMEDDTPHSYKWNLVAWLRAVERMKPKEIVAWIWNNCKWNDLNSLSITAYQVNWTCRWVDSKMTKNSRPPVNKWVLEDENEEF